METGALMQHSLYRDLSTDTNFDTDISVCKTLIDDEKCWF